MQVCKGFFSSETARLLSAFLDKLEEVLGSESRPVHIKSQQGQSGIDLTISGNCEQVKAMLPTLLHAADIQLAQLSLINANDLYRLLGICGWTSVYVLLHGLLCREGGHDPKNFPPSLMQQGFTEASILVWLQELFNLIKVRNEMYTTNSDPFFETLFDFHRFVRYHKAETQGKWCCSFITIVAGPWIWSVPGFAITMSVLLSCMLWVTKLLQGNVSMRCSMQVSVSDNVMLCSMYYLHAWCVMSARQCFASFKIHAALE